MLNYKIFILITVTLMNNIRGMYNEQYFAIRLLSEKLSERSDAYEGMQEWLGDKPKREIIEYAAKEAIFMHCEQKLSTQEIADKVKKMPALTDQTVKVKDLLEPGFNYYANLELGGSLVNFFVAQSVLKAKTSNKAQKNADKSFWSRVSKWTGITLFIGSLGSLGLFMCHDTMMKFASRSELFPAAQKALEWRNLFGYSSLYLLGGSIVTGMKAMVTSNYLSGKKIKEVAGHVHRDLYPEKKIVT